MRPHEKLTAQRGFYAILDPAQCVGRDPLWVAERILMGGCAVLQLRAKGAAVDAVAALGERLAAMCHAKRVPFVVNDDPALALALGADGLHLGQGDMPIAQARDVVGAMPIGLSTHNLAQARDAVAQGADLIGFGPVFATASKHNPDPVVGLDALRAVCNQVAVAVVAIGGIDASNIAQVAQTGAPLAAAIGAVCKANDPASAARALHTALRSETDFRLR